MYVKIYLLVLVSLFLFYCWPAVDAIIANREKTN